jgi:hypothetical protein
MSEHGSRWKRAAVPAAAALAAAGLAWAWADLTGDAVAPAVPRPAAAEGPARPVPAMEGWQPVGGGLLDGGIRAYVTDESPEAATVRASGRFRAAGWEALRAAPAGGDAGRHRLAFRSGSAVCWVVIEPDPRTGRTRCAVAGP